ncbi:MAG: hypothetical protein RIR00_25 [Pseudomonadota bacterium]|jgi:hypothetical protein
MKTAACGLVLGLLMSPALAEDSPIRAAEALHFKHAELSRPGACVAYREGGGGWILLEPGYWLKGKVVASGFKPWTAAVCPQIEGKTPAQYSRDEYLRWAMAYPCVAPGEPPRQGQLAWVRLAVEAWETPWVQRAVNQGRLYRGHYLRDKLRAGLELELPAELLQPCEEGSE